MQKPVFQRQTATEMFSRYYHFFIEMKKYVHINSHTHSCGHWISEWPWVLYPFPGLSATKDPNVGLRFLFSCKAQHFTKRKTLQRQSLSRIHFRAPFEIHIYLPYPITWSKQKCLAYFGGLKTSREKLETLKTTFFMPHIFLEENWNPLSLLSLNSLCLQTQKVRSES